MVHVFCEHTRTRSLPGLVCPWSIGRLPKHVVIGVVGRKILPFFFEKVSCLKGFRLGSVVRIKQIVSLAVPSWWKSKWMHYTAKMCIQTLQQFDCVPHECKMLRRYQIEYQFNVLLIYLFIYSFSSATNGNHDVFTTFLCLTKISQVKFHVK